MQRVVVTAPGRPDVEAAGAGGGPDRGHRAPRGHSLVAVVGAGIAQLDRLADIGGVQIDPPDTVAGHHGAVGEHLLDHPTLSVRHVARGVVAPGHDVVARPDPHALHPGGHHGVVHRAGGHPELAHGHIDRLGLGVGHIERNVLAQRLARGAARPAKDAGRLDRVEKLTVEPRVVGDDRVPASFRVQHRLRSCI